MKYEKSAGIVTYYFDIKNECEPEYLLLHYVAGHWDFPKGIIEQGESEIDAAHRELQEEAGIQAEVDLDFRHLISYSFEDREGNFVSKKVIFFVGCADEKNVIISHEHLDYKWLKFNDALRQLTYNNAKQLLILVDQYIKKNID